MAESGGDLRSRSWTGLAQLGLVVVVVLVALYFMRAPTVAKFDDVVAEGGASVPQVNVVSPVIGQSAVSVDLTGTVGLYGSVKLRSEVQGRVISVSPVLRSGGTFKASETLLTLDPNEFEIEVRGAEASVAAQRARLRKHELRGQRDREEFLRENPGQPVPAIVERQPQIERYKARVDRMLARLEKANLNLARTRFSLPFEGKVAATTVAVGELVGPLEPFGRAYARDAIEVQASITLGDLASLDPVVGRTAEVHVGPRSFPAHVERVSSVVAPRSRMATLYLRFDDSVPLEDMPLPGVFIEAAIQGDAFDNAFVLPDSAQQGDGSIWIVDSGVLASVSPSTLGRNSAGWIVSAFDARDGVVLGSVPGARTGLAVEVAGGENR